MWLISIFDDHSRYVLSSIKCIEGTSDRIIYLLKRTIRKYGKPLQILTDHDSQFYNSHSTLQSDFDSFCKEHDIQHVMGSIGKPTTLGKIERWHRTYDIETQIKKT